MSYNALARKYRPATFADMVGQSHVTSTLRAALRKGKLSHAYLFSGPRGCGKTTVARLLAKALNCAAGTADDPCGECETCQAIANGSYLDVLEIDAASNTGVDNIRDLRDLAQYTPTQGDNKVFIIDEVHMLSKGAFNALLKILEEPPARVFFFFATTEPNKIPRTILSRCQRFDFRLLSRAELSRRLESIAAAEGTRLEPAALQLVVTLAEGSLRDALSVLDQLIAASDGPVDEKLVAELFGLVPAELFVELNEAILAHDPRRALALLDRLIGAGHSLDTFAQGVVGNFRNLLLLKLDPALGETLDLPADQVELLARQAARFAAPDLLALIDRAATHYERCHRSTQPRLLLEAALVEYALFESRVVLADLVRRFEALAGAGAAAGDAGAGPAAGGGRGAGERAGAAGAAGPRPRPAPGRSAGPAGARPAAAATTVPGWTDFLAALLETQPRLGACLLEGLPSLDLARGRLTLAFPADKAFQREQVQQDLALLRERLAAHFGQPLGVTLVAGDPEPDGGRRAELRRSVAPTEHESLQAACRSDRPLADLVSLLGAEAVPAAEREEWTRPRRAAAPAPAAPSPAAADGTAAPDRDAPAEPSAR